MSVRESSAWASLGSIVAVYMPYFIYAYLTFGREPWRGGLMMGRILETMTVAIVLQIFLKAGLRVFFPVQQRPGSADDRNAAIEARSFRYAYRLLALLLLVLVTFVPSCVAERRGHITAFPFITQMIWLSFVFAESVKYLVRALGYQRGY